MLYYIDKNWYHFIKEYLEFSKFVFQEVAHPDQADIFWKFYLPADTFWSPKTIGGVLGYTTGIHVQSFSKTWEGYQGNL